MKHSWLSLTVGLAALLVASGVACAQNQDEAKVPSLGTCPNVGASRGTGSSAETQRHSPVFRAELKGREANQTPYEAVKALSIQGFAAFRNIN